MQANPIMIVSLNLPPEKEAEFNAFYHHRFLPAILKETDSIKSIRRYEETGINGTLRWHAKQYLTIYELASNLSAKEADEVFSRPGLQDLLREFQQWKANHLRNFSRMIYTNNWSHQREAFDGAFGSRPLLIWSHEMKAEFDEEFQSWYENDYLPKQIADIPSWAACRRYLSQDESKRRLTIFEAADENQLALSFESLRAAHRVWENFDWQRRVQQAVSWQDAASFRIIFRRPG